MKIAILICLSMSSMIISGCGSNKATQRQQMHTDKVAVVETNGVTENIQVATPVPQTAEIIPESPKPIVRRVTLATSPTEVVTAEIPEQPIATPAPAPITAIATPKTNWIPDEVHLIRGNELISGLQRDIGRKPTTLEMQQRLQTHMGLSALQADKVITTLGLQ
jgi:hypothetical protein